MSKRAALVATGALSVIILSPTFNEEAEAQGFNCFSTADAQQILQNRGEEPTNHTSSDESFDYTVYADPNDGSWTIIGKPKDTTLLGLPAGTELSCPILSGDSGYPNAVIGQDWYEEFFAPKP